MSAQETPGQYLLNNSGTIERSLTMQGEFLDMLLEGFEIGRPKPEDFAFFRNTLEGYDKSVSAFDAIKIRAERVAAGEKLVVVTRQKRRQLQRESDKLRDRVVALMAMIEKTSDGLRVLQRKTQRMGNEMKQQLEEWKKEYADYLQSVR